MENNEINLSGIWKKQTSISPDFQDLMKRIKAYKKESDVKRWISNISLALTCIVLISIWILYDSETILPNLGISLIILAIAISLIKFNQFYIGFEDLDKSLDNQSYLNVLLEIQKKQHAIQTNFMNIYFILLTLGLIIYMYEFASRMTMIYGITAYGLTLAWIAFVWFYLKPKMAKKQNLKLMQYINSIENIIENNI